MVLRFGRRPAGPAPAGDEVSWAKADPRAIGRALEHALAKPTGGWAVLDATRHIKQPRRFVVAGAACVAWPTASGVRVAPDACPHMGASLCEGRVDRRGRIVCPWHGLALGDAAPARTTSEQGARGEWATLPSFDDGVLSWVRLPALLAEGEQATDAPIRAPRPASGLDAVIRLEARCDPRDVLANRLDPWHGVHYHPHSFLRLKTLSLDDEQVTVRVVYRVVGPLGVEVDARFECPDARTIVMTIVDGDGVGSVVSTHACPMGPGQTAIIEATRADSDRPGFVWARRAGRLLRPWMERRAARLWQDDRAYAERLYSLREKSDAMTPRGGTE